MKNFYFSKEKIELLIKDIKRYWLMIKEDPLNIFYYLQGSIRMFLWNYLPIFLRKHIEEQFLYRFYSAKQCTENEACLFCGCSTRKGLYFANKACSLEKIQDDDIKNQLTGRTTACYPTMMNKYDWELYKLNNNIK